MPMQPIELEVIAPQPLSSFSPPLPFSVFRAQLIFFILLPFDEALLIIFFVLLSDVAPTASSFKSPPIFVSPTLNEVFLALVGVLFVLLVPSAVVMLALTASALPIVFRAAAVI